MRMIFLRELGGGEIAPRKLAALLAGLVFLFLGACLLGGCAGGPRLSVAIPIPIPADQPEKQWRLTIDFGLQPPADFSLPHLDRPVTMGLAK